MTFGGGERGGADGCTRIVVALSDKTRLGAELGYAGSQPDHAFPEPDGYSKSPKDTEAASFEFRRAVVEPAGHGRKRHLDGSGP